MKKKALAATTVKNKLARVSKDDARKAWDKSVEKWISRCPRGTARARRREAWAAVRQQIVVKAPISVLKPDAIVLKEMKKGKIKSDKDLFITQIVEKKTWRPTFQQFCKGDWAGAKQVQA